MAAPSNSKLLLIIAVVIVVGAGVAVAGSDGSTIVAGMPLFALCAALAYIINWLVYVPSNLAQTEKYFDLTGGVTYILVTLTALLLSSAPDTRAYIVATLVMVWAVRLASFLFLRINRDGKDSRFDAIKTRPLRFFLTWTLQGLWVLLTAAAALAVITTAERQPMGGVAIAGLVIWAIGFSIEVIADRQKSVFKADPANAGRFITTGLWSVSRHPNYFGEIVIWIGVAIIALPVLRGWQYVTLISPVFVTLLLTKVSGIPMLEHGAKKRWGDEPEFQDYTRNTSVLIPLPPKV
jgi:steroid 5-alpha reductase family enzyme